jgi:hypothetical protein
MTADTTLLKRWPDHLIERIVAKNFVLVLGAGISMGCQSQSGESPPNWDSLLRKLIREYTSSRAGTSARESLDRGDYLGAAELVRMKSKDSGKERDFLTKIAELTDGGSKPDYQYQPIGLHETLLGLDPDVLITTNYDRILERATRNGYKVHAYNSRNLGGELRAGSPVLIKIHGSVDDSSELILTRSDYSRLRRKGAHALEVVQALFLTRTVLFVGYSFSDPDVQLILENILGATGDVASHYLLTSSAIPTHIREIYRYCYGTSVISFKHGDFEEMRRMLELLSEAVELRRNAGLSR